MLSSLVAFVHAHGSITAAKTLTTTAKTFVASSLTTSSTWHHAFPAHFRGSPEVFLDFSGPAVNFFTSIRIPAALVAGSSLALMFTNQSLYDDKDRPQSPWHNRIMVLYHLFAWVAFLLSINVVSTATNASTYLLLGMKNPLARSAYELLRREVDLSFTSTRWCFDISLCSFLLAVAGRLLVEFNLLERQRRRTLGMLMAGTASLLFHFLAMTNASLNCWPHVGEMTMDLTRLLWKEACCKPLQAASLMSTALAVFLGGWACIRTKGFASLGYDEPSTTDTSAFLNQTSPSP